MRNNAQAPHGRDPSSRAAPEAVKAKAVATRYSRPKPVKDDSRSFSPKLAGDRAFVAEPTD